MSKISEINTSIWLLAAALLLAVMAGYYLWTAKEKAEVGEPVTTKRTVVTGTVFYSGDDQSEEERYAVIDGGIIHEGDIVHGANVVKIDRGEVEFEKNGKRWRQRVQEQPNSIQPEAD